MARPPLRLALPLLAALATAAASLPASGGTPIDPYAPGATAQPDASRPSWARSCDGETGGRQCLTTLRATYPNNRGGRNEVAVTLRRTASCSTLHVAFDAPIAIDRPAWISIDAGERHPFYTETELARFARAVDARQEPAWAPEEFRRFFAEVRDGRVASAGTELVARFARVKDGRRLGLACSATQRLMPELARGSVLTVEFQLESKGGMEPYHWPRMATRRVSVPLEGMLHALDSAAVRD
jgi:hypothetical protein